ncbi:chromosome condensation regulator RCC1 [Gracilaria domingensis]|nr:chromosome condensation regulator RCC1 [Gracilaria domingensis]
MQPPDQLGLAALEVFCPSPSPYSLPSGPVCLPHGIRAFAPGFNFALLVDNYYRLHSWGYNSEFQRLGRPLSSDHTEVEPTYVPISDVSAVVDCASGANHSVILTDEGRVYSFGSDDYGQLGRLSSDPRPAPVRIPARIIKVHSGWNFCVAVGDDRRSIFTWGSGKDGQLGHGYFPERSYPTRVALQGSALCVAVGHSHVAVLLENEQNSRRVLTWGADGLASTRQDLPRSVPRLPETDVVFMSAGKHFTIFLTEEGLVYAAGHGDEGQLGVEDRQGRNNACIIPSLLGHHIVNVVASNSFALALSSEGVFFVWGSGIVKPRMLREGILPFSSSYPNSFVIQMQAFGSTAMIAAPTSFPSNPPLRPFRDFLKQFCEGQVLDGLRKTRVHYGCTCSVRTLGQCNRCSIRAYGPLLATASNLIRYRLEHHQYLDLSMYDRDCVVRSVKLICCGVVDEDAALATLQEMSALLRRYESHAFERIIAEIMSTRLLRRTSQNRDYWDVYNDTPELIDERRLRSIFGRIQDSDKVQIHLKFADSDEATIHLNLDPLLVSAQSSAFREFLQSHIDEGSNSIPSQWSVFVWGGIISSQARSVLESWFRGSALIMPRDEGDNLAVTVYTDIVRVSMCLQMNVLMISAEQKLVHHTNSSITFNNWWNGLQVTEKAGCKHAHHKLLSVADSVCARIRLRHETMRVQKLEKSSSAVDVLFDQTQAARRALNTFRRSRVYCDWLMNTSEVAKNLQDACELEGYLIGEGDMGLNGRNWRATENEERINRSQDIGTEADLERRRNMRCCTIA